MLPGKTAYKTYLSQRFANQSTDARSDAPAGKDAREFSIRHHIIIFCLRFVTVYIVVLLS